VRNMRQFLGFTARGAGAKRPAQGFDAPVTCAALILSLFAAAGCSNDAEEKTLPSVQVAMDQSLTPIYDDGELVLYEVRLGVPLPIFAPTDEQRAALGPMEPYGTAPWLRTEDARLQLSWTLTNLDDEPHDVKLMIDPWNEYAKYYPGFQVTDADEGTMLPNLSGIEHLFPLGKASSGENSRRHGVFTYDDVDEMATDFATAMNLIKNPPPALGDSDPDSDATVVFVNHAFAFQNRSARDALVKNWVPPVIPALVGFDLALRTTEPAKVAVELVAEIVDTGSGKVKTEGRNGALLAAPTEIISIGSAVQ
jgi:hypothetical protein